MAEIYFTEKQKFTQKWLWIVMLGILLMFGVFLIIQLGFGIPVGNNPTSDEDMIARTAFILLSCLFLWSLRLDVFVSTDGISYRFPPIIWKYRLLKWDDIKEIEVREYDPLNDFFGWGIR